jgi:hypothetical protein
VQVFVYAAIVHYLWESRALEFWATPPPAAAPP